MHTCLTLANVGEHWYVEREVSGLIAALGAHCESIESCDIAVDGPSGEGEARCWRVALKIRVLGRPVGTQTQAPEGSDARQSLSRVLAYVHTSATQQLEHIARQHGGCCAARERDIEARFETCT